MRSSWLYTFSYVAICTALPIPSRPRLLPSLSIGPTPSINSTNTTLQSWPPTPWTRYISPLEIEFNEYGQSAPPSLEYDIITSIQSIYDQVLHEIHIENRVHWLQGANVIFRITYCDNEVMSREQIARILVDVQVLYLNHMFGPTEIESADVKDEQSGRMLANFQILFGLPDRAGVTTALPSAKATYQLRDVL